MSTTPANPIRTARPAAPSPDQGATDSGRGVLSPQQVEASKDGSVRERIVLLMMTLVTAAAAGMMHVQFGYPLAIALIGGFGVWGALLMLHTLIKRSGEVSRMRAEVARLELELARTRTLGSATAAKAAVSVQQPGVTSPAADSARPPESVEAKAQAIQARFDAQRNATAPEQAGEAMPYAHAPIAPDARWEQTNDMARARLVPSQAAGPTGGPGVHSTATQQGIANQGAPQQRPGAPHGSAMAGQMAPSYPPMGAPVDAPAGQRTPTTMQSARRSEAGAQQQQQRRTAARDGNDLVDVPAWSGTQASAKDPLSDAWSFQTGEDNAQPAFAPDATSSGLVARAPGARTVEGDLELVQRKIKALADEVNAGEALKAQNAAGAPAGEIEESISALRTTAERMRTPRTQQAPTAPPRAMPMHDYHPASAPFAPASQASDRTPVTSQPPSSAGQRSSMQPAMQPNAQTGVQGGVLPSLDALIPATAQPIAVSQPAPAAPQRAPEAPVAVAAAPEISAPHSAAPKAAAPQAPAAKQPDYTPQHRGAAPQASDVPQPRAPQAPARNAAQERRLAEIAAAIESSRMDVFLNPIVGLGDYAVTHFEINVRLKSAAGDYIDAPERTLSIGATDLLALFDIERLNRTAQVAEQLEARGKTGALLSPTAGPSMTDGKFLEAFARAFETRTSISGQLVLTFTQADIAAFGHGTWQALADMNSFGFRFALEHVTHFTTDFAELAARGFAFVKLPASAFLEGLPAGNGMVSPADICRTLAGEGLTLVVEAVDDEALLARVFGFGALYGQGALFGGARQITLEAPGPRTQAA